MSENLSSAAVRARLSHPVIDADGHIIEFMPAVRDHLVEVGGRELAEEFDAVLAAPAQLDALSEEERRAMGLFKLTWWAYPARNSLDRATGMLPGLLYERLDEFGLDYAVLYPTVGLTAMSLVHQTDLRRASVRSFNRCAAEMFEPYSDRLAPVAMIPMYEPGEAIDELEYCVNELGLKATLLNGLVYRPLGDDLPQGARWVDAGAAGSPSETTSTTTSATSPRRARRPVARSSCTACRIASRRSAWPSWKAVAAGPAISTPI
jgi:predicted TIM-barrel fold metal-dependent hydrolase